MNSAMAYLALWSALVTGTAVYCWATGNWNVFFERSYFQGVGVLGGYALHQWGLT